MKDQKDMNIMTRKAQTQIWIVGLIIVAVLGITGHPIVAHAASFDCKKASTPVEKRICANTQLSNLDSTLDSAYRLVLRSDYPNKEEVRREQKAWLAERNRCNTDECIQFAYEARITKLEAIFLLKKAKVPLPPPLPQNPPVPASLLGAKGKYPPYPDIWGYYFPYGISQVSYVSNGDVLVTHTKSIKSVQKRDGTCCDSFRQYGITQFFSAQTQRLPNDERRQLRTAIRSAHIYYSANRTVRFSDGSILKRTGYVSGKCYPLSPAYTLELIDPNGRVLVEKYLFILHESAVRPHVNKDPDCLLTNQPYLRRTNWPVPYLIPLWEDQVLILIESPALLVRFDKRLNTHSSLLNNRIFLIDKNEYEGIVKNAQTMLKKKYGSIYPNPHNKFNYNQLIDDAVAKHLNSIRGRK